MKLHLIIFGLCLSAAYGVNWNGNNWALGCDFNGGDFNNAQVRGEDCGGKCASTSGCTHFTWTSYNGGTCWMKTGGASQNDAFDSQDSSAVCGIVGGPPSGSGSGSSGSGSSGGGNVFNNVLATRHVNNGGDACALPSGNYAVTYPFALGNKPELGNLNFKPDLCGHVLRIDCGHGPLDIIITNSNYGGGLDLYSQSTWPKATNSQPPGEAHCSVQMTNKNPLNGGDYQCFYKPGTGTDNKYYRNVGLLNTYDKITTGATVGGQGGGHRGDNIYYAFDLGRPIESHEQIVFSFNDGSSHTVTFNDCKDVGSEQLWQ